MKKKFLLILSIILFVVIVEQVFALTGVFDRLELVSYDLRAKLSVDRGPFAKQFKHADKKIVIVAVDDYSRQQLAQHPEISYGSWPWPRDVWSGVTNFIERGQPKAILFDLVFANLNENHWNDRRLAQTFRQYDNIVLATALKDPKYLVNKSEANPEIENSDYLPTASPLDIQIEDKKLDDAITFYSHEPVNDMYTEHNEIGVVNKVLDKDSVVRRNQPIFKLVKGEDTYYMPSLAFAGFLKYMGEDGKITVKDNKIIYKGMVIPIDKNGETNISWHGHGHNYSYVPISKILLSQYGKEQINPDYFKDKIVIIGRTAARNDMQLSSVSSVYPGPETTATALDNFINDTDSHNATARKFVSSVSTIKQFGLVIALCGLFVLIGLFSPSALIGFIVNSALIFLYVIFSIWVFVNPAYRIWVPIVVPVYYFFMTAAIVFAYKFNRELIQKSYITNMVGKSVSPNVLSAVFKESDKKALQSSKKQITMMSCEVKDLVNLSNKYTPEQLVNNLNELFDVIVKTIFENNGTVDKFMGDGIIAYWGAPVEGENDAYIAVKTASAIKKKVAELKISNANENKIIFDVKIVISTGDALLGVIGAEELKSYTAMGDALNTSVGLESASAELKRDILVAKSTYDKVKDKVIVLNAGEIAINGKNEQIEIFELIGLNEDVVEDVADSAEPENEIFS